jgi:ribose transport system permease protein
MSAVSTTAATTGRRTAVQRLAARVDWRRDIIYIGFVVVFLVFAVLLGDQGFLSTTNLLNILRQTAIVTIIAVGMTFVIGSAEIDLSVGSIAGLASITTAMVISRYGLVAGVVAGLLVGVAVGAVNGSLVAYLRIPSFLVTLAMLGIAAGIAQWVTASAPQPILDTTYNTVFGSGSIGFLPGLVLWSAAAVALGAIVLHRARFGRHVLATGANRVAAEYSGIDTARIKFRVMMISATASALAGMLYAGRLHSGRFQWGAGDEMSAIAAVILGGTALAGGRGSVIGTLFGALLMGLINNGLILAGLDTSQQQVVRGVIIVLAVALARKK